MLLAVCLSQVIVTHYPMEIKAFYMKKVDKPVVVNGEDRYTVEAMDMLVPQVGRRACYALLPIVFAAFLSTIAFVALATDWRGHWWLRA